MKPLPQTEYPVHDLLVRRWSPRVFADRPVADEAVFQLLEAARWAASARNEQPWRFAYAHRQDVSRFDLLSACLNDGNAWARQAPVLLATCVVRTFAHNGSPNPHAWHDLGLAMGNLTAQATALGLYVHHMAGFDADQLTEVLKLPADIEPVTLVAIGYAADPAQLTNEQKTRELAPQMRKPIGDLILPFSQ